MQQHTGEHILSGALHRLFGAENVGFHIGSPYVRMDTSIPLTQEQLAQAEAEANAAVRADTPVHCWVPDPETLARTDYRSKKELTGDVRLVEAGGDCCACCGTHLARTGEVGLIKIISFAHYKSGMRLAVACGQRAYDAVAGIWADTEAAGRLLSSPVGSLTPALERLQNGEAALKARLAALQNTLAAACAEAAAPGTPAVLWVDGADGDGLRRVAMAITAKTNAPCCTLGPGGQGLAYALAAAPGGDVRETCKALNAAYQGRGGGKPGFCQGSLAEGSFEQVEGCFCENAFSFGRRWPRPRPRPDEAELSRLPGSGQYGRLSPHQSASRTASPPREKPLGNTAQFPPDGLSTAPADLRAKSRRKRRLRSEAPRCGSVCGAASALPKCSIRHPVLSALLA